MTITTLSSRQFHQDTSKAKKAAQLGPVFITYRDRPAHVLLTFDEYKRMSGMQTKIADLLAMPGIDEVDFEILQWRECAHPADFS